MAESIQVNGTSVPQESSHGLITPPPLEPGLNYFPLEMIPKKHNVAAIVGLISVLAVVLLLVWQWKARKRQIPGHVESPPKPEEVAPTPDEQPGDDISEDVRLTVDYLLQAVETAVAADVKEHSVEGDIPISEEKPSDDTSEQTVETSDTVPETVEEPVTSDVVNPEIEEELPSIQETSPAETPEQTVETGDTVPETMEEPVSSDVVNPEIEEELPSIQETPLAETPEQTVETGDTVPETVEEPVTSDVENPEFEEDAPSILGKASSDEAGEVVETGDAPVDTFEDVGSDEELSESGDEFSIPDEDLDFPGDAAGELLETVDDVESFVEEPKTQGGYGDDVFEEISQLREAEQAVDSSLDAALSLVNSIPFDSKEVKVLKEKVQSLWESRMKYSMALMDEEAIQALRLQVVSLHATCVYVTELMNVRFHLDALQESLESTCGSSKYRDLVSSYIVVSMKPVKNGNFVDRSQYTEDEKKGLFADEQIKLTDANKKLRSQCAELAAYLERKLGEGGRDKLDEQVDQLTKAEERFKVAASNILLYFDKVSGGPYLADFDSLNSLAALRDLFQTSADLLLNEIWIWKTIAKCEPSMDVTERRKYQDRIAIANICFDRIVGAGERAPLPRDLLKILTPSPSLKSSSLKSLETQRQHLIKWASTLIALAVDDGKPMSTELFDFGDLIWRPFNHTWLLRSDDDRRLIEKANAAILKKESKLHDFEGALRAAQRFCRPSTSHLPKDWLLPPDDSKTRSDPELQRSLEIQRAKERLQKRKSAEEDSVQQ